MEINVLVINTKIIQGNDLDAIIQIAKDDYGCARLPSHNHFLLAAIHDTDVDDVQAEIESLHIGNPAYEITRRTINSQAELKTLSYILELEPR
nr:hypothetical protein [uncultured Pedobacter sp.]